MVEKVNWFFGQLEILECMFWDFCEFDDQFIGLIYGFRDVEDYWISCSSIYFILIIEYLVLFVSVQDDIFLSESCYFFDLAWDYKYFYFEVLKWGGYVGFVIVNWDGYYWIEKWIFDFLNQYLEN